MAKTREEDSQVRVAKITAFQAIVVAVITVAGGSLGYFIGGSGKTKTETKQEIKQNWLTIKDVNYSGSVRIVVNVNGNNFSYPSDRIWAGNVENAPQEKFPLPIAEQYNISVTALVGSSDPGYSGSYATKEFHTDEIGQAQIPTGEKTAFCIPNASSTSGLKPTLKLSYAIE